MTDYYLINIIVNSMTLHLYLAMAYYKDCHCDPAKWKKKLRHMDFITTKFQQKEQDN